MNHDPRLRERQPATARVSQTRIVIHRKHEVWTALRNRPKLSPTRPRFAPACLILYQALPTSSVPSHIKPQSQTPLPLPLHFTSKHHCTALSTIMAPKSKSMSSSQSTIGPSSSKLKPATSINVRHILCEKHSVKEKALALLAEGKKFDEVARELSEDKARQG